jgi:hypothetical protein
MLPLEALMRPRRVGYGRVGVRRPSIRCWGSRGIRTAVPMVEMGTVAELPAVRRRGRRVARTVAVRAGHLSRRHWECDFFLSVFGRELNQKVQKSEAVRRGLFQVISQFHE